MTVTPSAGMPLPRSSTCVVIIALRLADELVQSQSRDFGLLSSRDPPFFVRRVVQPALQQPEHLGAGFSGHAHYENVTEAPFVVTIQRGETVENLRSGRARARLLLVGPPCRSLG